VIILVTASRKITREAHGPIIRRTLAYAAGFRSDKVDPDHELWDGLADGGDAVCHEIATEDFGWKERRFPPNWSACSPERVPGCEPCTPAHRRVRRNRKGDFCPTAGFRRNQLMVDTLAAMPDRKVCVAFPIPAVGSLGTFDCLARALRAGIYLHARPLDPARESTS